MSGAKALTMGVAALALVGSAVPAAGKGFAIYVYAYLDSHKRPAIMVSAEIGYPRLVFLKKGRFYEASYQVFVKIMDRGERILETEVLKDKIVVGSYKETKNRKHVSKVSHSFAVPPGKYLIEASLLVKDTQILRRKRVAVEVPDFLASGLSLSKPRLFALIPPGSSAVYVELNSSLRASAEEMEVSSFADFEKQPAVLFELYTRDERLDSVPCTLFFEVRDREKRQVLYGKRKFVLSQPKNSFLLTFNVDQWEPGSYRFSTRASLGNKKEPATTSLRFTVEFSRAMLGKFFRQTLAILSLIASPEEMEELEKAPYEDRPRLWAEFWRKRDPTPETEANEALEEHLRRVRYVAANFSTVEPGWKTDRGKVYIKFGEPDQIDTSYGPYMQGEYQVWRYFAKNLVFIFYDRYGLGDYRLVEASGL